MESFLLKTDPCMEYKKQMEQKATYIKEKFTEILGFEPDDTQTDQLIKFYEMTVEKNKVMNLTAITEFEEFVMKHYVDSLSIIKVIDLKDKNYSLIDIGTGAGFPGIPLKIMFPELDITLFDSLQKRLAFLDEIIRNLGLKKIVTVHGRAEEFGRKLDYREKYDIVVSRAVAELTPLCELSIPFCKVGGYFIAYKGMKGDIELKSADRAIKVLGGKLAGTYEFTLPATETDLEKDSTEADTNSGRFLIKISKIKSTDNKYPRGGGKPFKTPLYIEKKANQ